MPKGGARPRSGPAPDPNALRRERDAGEWTVLPAEGRQGDAPDWPLTEPNEREDELWSAMWVKPQALMWERYGQDVEVALYIRRLVETEGRGSLVSLGTLVRQMADSLGLTTPGMRANRWRIAALVDEPSIVPAPDRAAQPSARQRMTVLPGGRNSA